ncbi:MAG: N-acetyltransferase [Bacteroidetes bacterium SW_4_67_19]|jgi:GNAT superfamily N-acetyltransferase|nr:MAG: N-acetyltransferase [Bacteroidetes bacterium SW_4_67_19]
MADDENITLRRAEKRDKDRVAVLWTAFLEEQAEHDARFEVADDARERFDNDFPVWIDDGTQRTVVAERAGEEGEAELIGFATAHRWGPPPIYAEASEVFVDEFYVAPEARRQGVGRRLAEALGDWADELDADRLRLRVLHDNEAGRAFWQSVGGAPFAVTMTVEREREERAEERPEQRRIGF